MTSSRPHWTSSGGSGWECVPSNATSIEPPPSGPCAICPPSGRGCTRRASRVPSVRGSPRMKGRVEVCALHLPRGTRSSRPGLLSHFAIRRDPTRLPSPSREDVRAIGRFEAPSLGPRASHPQRRDPPREGEPIPGRTPRRRQELQSIHPPGLSHRYPRLQWERYLTARGAKGPRTWSWGSPSSSTTSTFDRIDPAERVEKLPALARPPRSVPPTSTRRSRERTSSSSIADCSARKSLSRPGSAQPMASTDASARHSADSTSSDTSLPPPWRA